MTDRIFNIIINGNNKKYGPFILYRFTQDVFIYAIDDIFHTYIQNQRSISTL